MSLVQYDSSDDEVGDLTEITKEAVGTKSNSDVKSLFESLPAPKSNIQQIVVDEVEADDDFTKNKEFLSRRPSEQEKKRKQPVKIMVPNINEFPEESTSKAKKAKVFSGLMDILPAPRNASVSSKTVSLVPHAVTKKATDAVVKKTKVKESSNTCLVDYDDKDSDTEEINSQNDFFSLNLNKNNDDKNNDNEEAMRNISESNVGNAENNANAPLNFTHDLNNTTESSNIIIHEDQEFQIIETPITYEASVEDQSQEASQSQEIDFTDERFLRLQGKKQRGKEEIQIIDISADQQLPNENLLIKNLTDESLYYSSRKKGKMPTSQQRRKHQITYLAFQAKERELELKNQWAKNRMTRRQTQAKYGF